MLIENTQPSPSNLPTGTLTFLFTDVEGSTRLWEIYPEAMRAAMARHDELIESIVAQSGGLVVRPRGEGDSRFAVFQRATGAAVAAITIQRQFYEESWSVPHSLRVRIALHTGEADLRDGDYYGTAVNRCARLRSAAHGGQILLSQTTQCLVTEALPDGVGLFDLGEHKLKDLERSEHIYQLTIMGLPTDFPPLRTQEGALTNVPIPRNPLIGREQELQTACTLLLREDVGLLTLTGSGGTGKSRLGIHIALELGDRFSDGVYLVALESISDADLVIPTIARTLGITEIAGGPPLLELLKGFLCNKQMLLLLDNFEQVLATAPKIAELLEACPRAKFLITSRAPLRLRAEFELPVPPLRVAPLKEAPDLQSLSQYSAVQLFIQRAQSVKPDFQVTNENAPAVAEICHRLDGLPLAIELASARIKMLSPQVLLARLERRFEVLHGGARDLPERQHTLYSAIDWSYNLLDEDQKRLFRNLSVFAGGWTLESVEAVCSADGKERIHFFDELENLIDNNLLKPPDEVNGELRFSMLQTIREFAYEHLMDSDEAHVIHTRHAQYCLSLAERAETEMHQSAQQAWHKRLEAELDNLRVAMSWSLDQGQSELALRIAMALWIFWWSRGYRREGLQWLEKGLASPESVPDAVRAKALNRTGFLTRESGDYPRAIAMLQESLALWRQIDDQAGIALSLDKLGTTVMRQGDYARASAMLKQALDLWRQLGDQHGTYATLMNLGLAAAWQGHNQRAIELYRESLALAREAGDDHTLGIILTNLGEVYANQGDYDQAEACYLEAASIYQMLGNRAGTADVSRNRGVIALKQGNYDQAFDLLVASILAFQEMDDKEYTILCIEVLASLAEEQHFPERAARLLGASESLRKVIGVARISIDQVEYDACLAGVRGQLGEAAFAAAWAQGIAMAFEQAVAYAISKPDLHPN